MLQAHYHYKEITHIRMTTVCLIANTPYMCQLNYDEKLRMFSVQSGSSIHSPQNAGEHWHL